MYALPQALKCSRVLVARRRYKHLAAGRLSHRMGRLPMLSSALVLPVGDIDRLQHNMNLAGLGNALDNSRAWLLFECGQLY